MTPANRSTLGLYLAFVAQWVDGSGYAPASGSGLDLLRDLLAHASRRACAGRCLWRITRIFAWQWDWWRLPTKVLRRRLRIFNTFSSVGGRSRRQRTCPAIARFWIGRYHRMEGRYDDALLYTEQGRDMALALDVSRR